MSVRIKGIEKDNGNHANPHEAIQAYCWINEENRETGKTNRPKMVAWVEKGNIAYVTDSQNHRVRCYVRESSRGNKFLQTHSDGRYTNNLLQLPEC